MGGELRNRDWWEGRPALQRCWGIYERCQASAGEADGGTGPGEGRRKGRERPLSFIPCSLFTPDQSQGQEGIRLGGLLG